MHPAHADLFVTIEPLPALCRPARAIRRNGMTLLWLDPLSLRTEAVEWCVDNLTYAERDGFRLGMGWPPMGQPLPWDALEGIVASWAVPAALRLPDEQQATG